MVQRGWSAVYRQGRVETFTIITQDKMPHMLVLLLTLSNHGGPKLAHPGRFSSYRLHLSTTFFLHWERYSRVDYQNDRTGWPPYRARTGPAARIPGRLCLLRKQRTTVRASPWSLPASCCKGDCGLVMATIDDFREPITGDEMDVESDTQRGTKRQRTGWKDKTSWVGNVLVWNAG